MYRFLIPVLLILILSGCSSQKEVVVEGEKKIAQNSVSSKEAALEHFIDGSIAESKGDYATAILEFQDALRLDPDAGIYYALAKNYYFLNKLSLALQNAKESVELSPEKIEYLQLLGDIYSTARQYDSAAAAYETVIKLDSTDIGAHYRLARILENEKPLKAIGVYEKLFDLIGPDWNILIRVAELYEKLGDIDKAILSIEELLALDPSNTPIKKLLIEFYEKDERYNDALNMVNDILELTPDDINAREQKARIYLAQNEWEKAASEYSYILEQPDILLDVKVRIGASYFAQSLKDSALIPIAKDFFEKIDKDTTDWQVKMYLGAIALTENNDSLAIENFQQVTELASWNVDAWIRLGGLYFDNQKYDEAAKVMYECIESFPEDFTVNLILGLSLAQDDKHTEAVQYLKKSTELNPADVNALSAYGYTLSQLKENNEAIEYLNKALAVEPGNVNLLGTLGLIYDSIEDWEACDSVYQKALELDSSNALVNNNYAYSLSEREINLDEALRMAKIAIEADPENSSYLDTIGWIYFKMGDYDKAKNYIEESIEIGGEKAVMLEHLGDVVFMMGNKDKAKELWQKAFNLDITNSKLKEKIEKGEI